MKITREDALAILEVEEDATMDIIRKAYLSKSREWHPDKHPEEEREAATEEFKKIGGAYAKLQKDEESSDEEDEGDYDFTDINDMYEMFFAAMGIRPGPRGGTFFFPTADGGFATHVHPGRRPQQCPQCGGYHYDGENGSHEDSDYDSEDSHDSEWYRQRNEDYLRAQEQTLEQLRRDREAEEAKKLARYRERWTEALARPALIGATDTQLHIRGDPKRTRMSHFPSGPPKGFTLEVQYRRAPGGCGTGGTHSSSHIDGHSYTVVLGERALRAATWLDVVIPGLNPGSCYYVKTRGCCGEGEGEGLVGAWSVESKFLTKGAQKVGASKSASTTAAPVAAPPGQGKKARRKAKQAAAAEQSGAPGAGQQPGQVDEAAAAAAAKLEEEAAAKQREKEAAIKAAIEAAAADYEMTAAKVKAAAERAAAKKAAAQAAAPTAAAPSSSSASAATKLLQQQQQASSEAEAAQSKKNRKKNKAATKQHFDSTANGTGSPAAAHHHSQPQQSAHPGTFGSQPAMMAPTQRNLSLLTEKQKQEAVNLGLSQEEYAQCLRAEMELGIHGGGGGGGQEEEEEEDSLWSDAAPKIVFAGTGTRASTGVSTGNGAGAGGYTAEQVQQRQQRQYEDFQKQRQLQNNTARREQQEQEARHAMPARGSTEYSKPVAPASAAPAAAPAPARPSRVAPPPAASPAAPPAPLPPHFFMPMHPASQAPRPQPRPAPAPASAAAYARAPAPAPAPLPAVAALPSAPKFVRSPVKSQPPAPRSPDPSRLPAFTGLPTLPDSLFQEPWSNTTAPALQQQQAHAQPAYGHQAQQTQHAQQQRHVPQHHLQQQQPPGQSSFFGSLPDNLEDPLEDSLDSAPAFQDLLPFLYEAE